MVLKTPGIHSEVTQLDSRQWSVFNSRLSKFVLEGSWEIKFVILVENFNTDCPSSIAVKKEFLFAFNSDLAWATNGGGRQETLFCYFFVCGCFACWWVRVGGAGQQLPLIFLFLVLLKKMRMQDLSLIFTYLGTFYHHRS